MSKGNHPPLVLNNDNVLKANSQKHLGVVSDNPISRDKSLKMIINKVNKTIDLLRKLHKALQRSHQLIIYKAFMRNHLDHCCIISDQDYNTTFHQKYNMIYVLQ